MSFQKLRANMSKPFFHIVESISQGGTLYLCYDSSDEVNPCIGPAHEHEDQVAAIRKWVARTARNKGLSAFDDLANEFIVKVLGKTAAEVSAEYRRAQKN